MEYTRQDLQPLKQNVFLNSEIIFKDELNVKKVEYAIKMIEQRLKNSKFYITESISETDVRIFTTIIR